MNSIQAFPSISSMSSGPLCFINREHLWTNFNGSKPTKFLNKAFLPLLAFFYYHTSNWIPQDQFKRSFHLNDLDKATYDIILELTPYSILHKISLNSQNPCWKYWGCHVDTPLLNYRESMGYNQLLLVLPTMSQINEKWYLVSIHTPWKQHFVATWASYLEPKKSFFFQILLNQGLLLNTRLKYLGVPDPHCAFCNEPDSTMHIFWLCNRSISMWEWVSSFFAPYMPILFSQQHALSRGFIHPHFTLMGSLEKNLYDFVVPHLEIQEQSYFLGGYSYKKNYI